MPRFNTMSIPSKPLVTPRFPASPTPVITTTAMTENNNMPNLPSIPNLPNIPQVTTATSANNTTTSVSGSGSGSDQQQATIQKQKTVSMDMNTILPMANISNMMNMNMPLGMPNLLNINVQMGMPMIPSINMPMTMPNMGSALPTLGNIPSLPEGAENTFEPAVIIKQNQLIQQVQNKAGKRTHFSFESFLKKEYDFGLDPDRPACEYWIHSNGLSCPMKDECPLKHPAKGFKNKIVCKYWLRGLCKMGDNCDFLHEYNLSKMPECAHYAQTGTCAQGSDCVYLHVDPQTKVPECWNYTNMGFCPDGPKCTKRHVKRTICERYLTGFCPKGKGCEKQHPQFKVGLLHGRFKFLSDDEIIGKRLKDKMDYDAKIKLENDLKERQREERERGEGKELQSPNAVNSISV